MPNARTLWSAYAVMRKLRSARRFLQRDGLAEVGAPKILEIEAVIDVCNRGSELDPDVLFADPGHGALDEGAVEKGQDKFFVSVGNSSVENTDLGAGFREIDQIANPSRIAKLYSHVLMRGVAKFVAPVAVLKICRGDNFPAERIAAQLACFCLSHRTRISAYAPAFLRRKRTSEIIIQAAH